jgi:hypothetical protein
MNPSDDPVALLPFAVLGLIVGLGLAAVGGIGLYERWANDGASVAQKAGHAFLDGRIAEARWRRSAAAGGPDWYLQVRISGDRRGFLVAAQDLPASERARLGFPPGSTGDNRRGISALMDRPATVVVDSSLRRSPGNPTPYLSALRVGGTTVLPLNDAGPSDPLWRRAALTGLLIVSMVAGWSLFGASAHHIRVCLRHRRPRS